jgi:hypothetical protein
MTEQQVDRLVAGTMTHSDAAVARLDLHGAEHELLEAIMSTPVIDHADRLSDLREASAPGRLPAPRRPRRPRLLTMVAVAAAFVAAIAIPSYVTRDGDGADRRVTTTYTSQARRTADANPRLLVDEPGWKVTHVDEFDATEGEMRFGKGRRELEVNWRKATDYDSYYADRSHDMRAAPVQVFGAEGSMFSYGARDFTVILPVDGKVFLEIRGGVGDRAAFLDVLGKLKQVDVDTWLGAMPASVVKPGDETRVADEMLADIPLPPGFDKRLLPSGGTNDYYQYGAAVTGKVVCSWIEEYRVARGAGDPVAMKRATDALAGTHDWSVLSKMNAEGDWPEVVWEISDQIVGGKLLPPLQYQQGLGCD